MEPYSAKFLEDLQIRVMPHDELCMLAAGLAGAGNARFILQEPWDSIEITDDPDPIAEEASWMGFL